MPGFEDLSLPQIKSSSIIAGLTLVSTPIGNLSDITLRALYTLQNCDFILCEDTRVSTKLLQAYGISKPLKSFHDHNSRKMIPEILTRLKKGEKIALISDAGTPLVSDPGFDLVRAAIAQGISVTSAPGASSVMTALVLSGLPSDNFCFLGFIPPKKGELQKKIEPFQSLPATLIFFETSQRILKSLPWLLDILSDRRITLCRELTKLYEEKITGTISEVVTKLKSHSSLKGEMVLVIEGNPKKEKADYLPALKERLKTASLKEASEDIARAFHVSKREVYQKALDIK